MTFNYAPDSDILTVVYEDGLVVTYERSFGNVEDREGDLNPERKFGPKID